MNVETSGPGIAMVLDCADGPRLAEFWSATLNYPITREVEQFTILRPADDADPRPQLILQQVARMEFAEVDSLEPTSRGDTGHGASDGFGDHTTTTKD